MSSPIFPGEILTLRRNDRLALATDAVLADPPKPEQPEPWPTPRLTTVGAWTDRVAQLAGLAEHRPLWRAGRPGTLRWRPPSGVMHAFALACRVVPQHSRRRAVLRLLAHLTRREAKRWMQGDPEDYASLPRSCSLCRPVARWRMHPGDLHELVRCRRAERQFRARVIRQWCVRDELLERVVVPWLGPLVFPVPFHEELRTRYFWLRTLSMSEVWVPRGVRRFPRLRRTECDRPWYRFSTASPLVGVPYPRYPAGVVEGGGFSNHRNARSMEGLEHRLYRRLSGGEDRWAPSWAPEWRPWMDSYPQDVLGQPERYPLKNGEG